MRYDRFLPLLIAGALFVGSASLAMQHADAQVSRDQLDLSLAKATEGRLFHVALRSTVDPIPMNRIHSWTINLTDANGQPLSGATIGFDGGMPEHHHGLPTAPRVVPGSNPGEYLIQGLRFSMPGWWELKLVVAAGGRDDNVTFNVVL